MDLTQEKCPICYEPFNYNKKPYLLLICGHTFCNPCISRIKKECLEDDSKYKSLSDFYREQKKAQIYVILKPVFFLIIAKKDRFRK